MYNHAPVDYTCPICVAIEGTESEQTMILQEDIFYRDDLVVALLASKFVGNSPGHALVVPLEHYENLYDLPAAVAHRIIDVSKEIAKALKHTRQCDGVMVQQNNEPASGQHAFHYHMHLFPRFNDDDFRQAQTNVWVATAEERKPLTDALMQYFAEHPIAKLKESS